MNTNNNVWVIFAADSKKKSQTLFPIGVYATEIKAKEELENLTKDQKYQLFKFSVDEFFGYFLLRRSNWSVCNE